MRNILHTPIPEKRYRARAFALVETLLATAIMVFGLCAILITYISCLLLITTAKNINIATNATLSLMEGIRSSDFTQISANYNGLNFVLNDIPLSRGVVYVDDTNAELLQVDISVCWQQGNRVIGEDANLNGMLDPGEDVNGNGIIDSTVKATTLIANR
ncbi:MAG: hypothetical protein C4533_00590 [Candidatus Omnitrophota bacterium]|jgi:Tfp pilus assembly protein PilV|nr:MAG: hypothetical protein C4533_00590 [Candidatus Omnitrophota bacterium]